MLCLLLSHSNIIRIDVYNVINGIVLDVKEDSILDSRALNSKIILILNFNHLLKMLESKNAHIVKHSSKKSKDVIKYSVVDAPDPSAGDVSATSKPPLSAMLI